MKSALLHRSRARKAQPGLPTLLSTALLINGIALLFAATVLIGGWSRAEWLVRRGAVTHEQLEILAQASGVIDRYLELIERASRPEDLQNARRDVDDMLARWRASVEREAELMDAPAADLEKREERARIASVRSLIAHAEEALLARREPLWVTRTQIGAILEASTRDERAEVQRTTTAIVDTGWMIAALAIGVPLAALCLAGVMNLLVVRIVRQRLRRLMAGAAAIGSGDLGYRFDGNTHDDLGLLAVMFNRMAARLRRSRTRLERLQRELEARVVQRTAELEQRNRQLQAIDNNREQFFGEISHELRTPLTALRGEAEVSLRQPEDSAGIRDALRHIVSLAADLERSIEDLVTLARSQTRELLFVRERIALDTLLERTVSAGRALGLARKIDVQFVRHTTRSGFWGDSQRLQQVFLTLVDNAVKHAPPASEVTVVLDASPAAGLYRVSFIDRGAGIPRAIRNRVFDDFYQGESSQRSGMGLGLAIARRVVNAHGGSIDIFDAEPGRGTHIRISLPLFVAQRGRA